MFRCAFSGSLAYTQCRANCDASKVQPLKRFPEFDPETFEVSSEDEVQYARLALGIAESPTDTLVVKFFAAFVKKRCVYIPFIASA